jgi:Domain of unknown function (DUF4190)
LTDISWEHADEARAALTAIVSDPDHGEAALSSAQTMSNLLKDLLPDAPREKRILIAAAEAGLAGTLREHVAQGMDPATAIRLTASSLETSTPYPAEVCSWVTGEIATALGISAPMTGGPGGYPQGAGQGQATWAQPGGFGQPTLGQPDGFDQPTLGQPGGFGQPTLGQPGGFGQPILGQPGQGQQTWGQPGYAAGTGYQPTGFQGAGPGSAQSPGSIFPQPPNPAYGAGQRYPQGYQPAPGYGGPRSNPLAITALVCGCAQFLLWFLVLIPGFLSAAAALVFGIIGIRQVKARGERGSGFAIAGIVLGGLGVLGGVFWIIAFAAGAFNHAVHH